MCYVSKMRVMVATLIALGAPTSVFAQCPHEFMPYRNGTVWVYAVTGPSGQKVNLTVSVDSIDVRPKSELIQVRSRWSMMSPKGEEQTLSQISQSYRCAPDGMHTAPDTAKASDKCPAGVECTPNPKVGVKSAPADTINSTGVALPPADQLQVGAQWAENFDMQITRPANEIPMAPSQANNSTTALGPVGSGQSPGNSGSSTVRTPQTGTRTGHATRTTVNKIDAREMVDTPMGPIEAIKILGDQTVKMPFDDRLQENKSVTWLGRNVGMIRFTDGTQTMELVRFVPGT